MNLTPQQRMEAKARRREASGGQGSSLQTPVPIHPKRARLLASTNPPPSRPSTPPPLYEELPVPSDLFTHLNHAEAGLRQPEQVNKGKPDKPSWWRTRKGITLIVMNMIVLGAILGGVLGSTLRTGEDHPAPGVTFPGSQLHRPFPGSSIVSTPETMPSADIITTTVTGSQMSTVDPASGLSTTPDTTVGRGPLISTTNMPTPFPTG
ncbi:hypothetical protein D9756_007825 [Leucocoprinus leucothites]|uniref:Uncharacterized protein n=1 Tax=Leucocoprinus leucothites TaxID=201217 RepID=A0A8H5D475_9AGAR|nr:hypothetical protein D9756_007825 [Leucoagaricus leucothites]